MGRLDLGARESYFGDLRAARQEFAGVSESGAGDHRSGSTILIDMEMVDRYQFDYLQHQVRELLQREKDQVYQAVVMSPAEWTAIRSRIIERPAAHLPGFIREIRVEVDSYVADQRVYVPVYQQRMPLDVFSCSYCGGYTKNDKRGNCAACGGPRHDDPNKWGWLY